VVLKMIIKAVITHPNLCARPKDTKGATRSRKSQDRQRNGQKKKDKQQSTKHYTEN
jgi:hypothetical protein